MPLSVSGAEADGPLVVGAGNMEQGSGSRRRGEAELGEGKEDTEGAKVEQ